MSHHHSPTPLQIADTDHHDPTSQISTRTAVLLIIGGPVAVLLPYIYSGLTAGAMNLVFTSTNYNGRAGGAEIVSAIGLSLTAITLLYLVARWLTISRDLLGLPRRGATPFPTAAVILAMVLGQILSAYVPLQSSNATGGGTVNNTAGWIALTISSLKAGFLEEILVVAVPVLLGRRAGWHPLLILAISGVLRWPYHGYHGLWLSLPWAMAWGIPYAAAYLYLRRLTPLILGHALYDLKIYYNSLETGVGETVFDVAVLAFGVWFTWAALRHRRNAVRRDLPHGDTTPDAIAWQLRRQRKTYVGLTAVVVGAAVLIYTLPAEDLTGPGSTFSFTARTVTVIVLAAILTSGIQISRTWYATTNVIVHRSTDTTITGLTRWIPTAGDNAKILSSTPTTHELQDAATIAVTSGLTTRIDIPPRNKNHIEILTDAGVPASGRLTWMLRTFLITPALAPTVLEHLAATPTDEHNTAPTPPPADNSAPTNEPQTP